MRKLFLIIFISIPLYCQSQFSGEGSLHLSVETYKGFILLHKKQVSHLIIDHPVGLKIDLDRRTRGTALWQQRYNYPEAGLTCIYQDYNNEKIGKSIAVIPHFNLFLTRNPSAKSQWKYQIGLGLGYNTNKYDPVENNKNNVLGTYLNFGIELQILNQLQISDRLCTLASLSLIHFSNGSIKKPNSGINTINANIGLSYRLSPSANIYEKLEEIPLEGTGIGYTATLSGGMHEATKIGAGSFPFFVLSGLIDKRLNHKSRLGIGVEWFYSASLKDDIKYDDELDGKTPDFNRIGLVLSHELVINDFSLMTQAGYYVYDPYKPFEPFYLRAGLRRYFDNHIFASLCVKSHFAKAEAAEFAIGYRIK